MSRAPSPTYGPRAKLGGLIRAGATDDDPQVQAVRAELRKARAESEGRRHARDLVATWPLLDDEQRADLRALLAPAIDGGSTAA